MSEHILCIYQLSIDPAQFATFRELISGIVAKTREESGTLAYEYSVNADHTAVHIIERYNADAVMSHIEQTFAPFAERFLELAKIEALFVYGAPDAALRQKLDGFGAIYMTPFDGFHR